MYHIHSIIWGTVITDELCTHFQQMEDEMIVAVSSENVDDIDLPVTLGKLDGGWFETLYSGDSPREVGYFGECIAEFPASKQMLHSKIEQKKKTLSDERKEEIRQEFEKLPDWIKERVPTLGWHTVVSTS